MNREWEPDLKTSNTWVECSPEDAARLVWQGFKQGAFVIRGNYVWIGGAAVMPVPVHWKEA